MKKLLLGIACALGLTAGASNAATITTTQGLALDVSAGFSLQGLEALMTVDSVAADQMVFTVYSEFGGSGSVLSTRALPFAASG